MQWLRWLKVLSWVLLGVFLITWAIMVRNRGLAVTQVRNGRTPPAPILTPLPDSEVPPPDIPVAGLTTGQKAPAFTLPTLDGGTTSLADHNGKRVLINFWATWCPPCRAEMPAIQRLYERYRGQDFVVLAVDFQESEDVVRPFVQELGLTFPILLDETGDVARDYRVLGLPSSYFVDREGTIRQVHIGAMSEEFMETTLGEIP